MRFLGLESRQYSMDNIFINEDDMHAAEKEEPRFLQLLLKDKDNLMHQMQWEHLSITIDVAHKAIEFADNDISREFSGIARSILDPALHSCQFWWASKKPMWDINMVYRGLNLQREVLLNAYKAISKSGMKPEVKKEYYYKVVAARHIFDQITDNSHTLNFED